MKIAIMGAGHMGSWLTAALRETHELAVFDIDSEHLRALGNVKTSEHLEEVADFSPELAINAVGLRYTKEAFEQLIPLLPQTCIIADIASVKHGLKEFYEQAGRPFVSTHPMFGPTFANIQALKGQNAIIIQESCPAGKQFFQELFAQLHLNIFEYTFQQHDETIAYSLATPFASTITFAACMKQQEAPGTTFQRHREIAQGLLAEDEDLLAEILFAPGALQQIEKIASQLAYLTHIIRGRDYEVMKKFLHKLRENVR